MNESEIKNIKNIVSISIDNKFNKLNTQHKNLIKDYLLEICILIRKYMPYDSKYMDSTNYLLQLKLNNYQDIFSLLVLLLPYFELNTCYEITDLGELFYNKDDKSKNIKSTYYNDHIIKNDDDIQKYFRITLLFINRTLAITCNKLTPNWLNIFPYTINNYKTSDVYKEFLNYWYENNFPNYNSDKYYNFKLGYHTLYGVIKSFLFEDIKHIKWMIYDATVENEVYPIILKVVELLNINNITNEPWNKLLDDRKKEISSNWYDLTNSANSFNIFSQLILFYLRRERDNDTLNNLKIPKECLKIIKTNLDIVDELDEDTNINAIIIYGSLSTDKNIKKSELIKTCLIEIFKNLSIENIYNYIYDCCQQFRYTWYGYKCMDENKKFLTKDEYFEKYLNDSNVIINFDMPTKYYITPKMTYNYFKSLLHYQKNTKDENEIDIKQYIELSNSNSWDGINRMYQDKFKNRLNNFNDENIKKWFNIKGNIRRLYNFADDREVNAMQQFIEDNILQSDWIPQVIFECLVYNGILTYFKYNPEVTDKTLLPDKNKKNIEWSKVLLSRVSLEPYKEAYHFLDNKILGLHDGLLEGVKKSKWYTNFGADWICQIQVFHHFIHQRILFVTGATGAGKSTVFPFMMLYALKIINYNNNGKVFCTQPRKQPTIDNATRMANSLGIPIKSKDETLLDGSIKKEYNKSDIDYIQYKFLGGNITDDLYHPTLRLLTDGTLYQMIKNDYIFKSRNIGEYTNENGKITEPFTKYNLFDILLIDESHEHNPYMDMILTLCKFALYINNEVTLGIVSATMDDDEPIYRKYYEPINDDWKAPLKLDLLGIKEEEELIVFNRNILDRRIHLSVPFGGMNFDVLEISDLSKNDKEIEIIKEILSTSNDGDILVFKPGSREIKELVKKINDEIANSNVIAIPFMSDMSDDILDIVKGIAELQNRKKFRYDKKIYDIFNINYIPENEKLPEGIYTRFIIVATNIAEASITIDTLKYVIDDGKQKIMFYNVDTNQSNLIVKPVSAPNQKQRKGRIGRVQPGTIYYTYDIKQLEPKVIYQICSGNINDKILDLLSINSDEQNEFKFTNVNNPYLISIDEQHMTNINLQKLPTFLQNQYSFINRLGISVLFYLKKPININYTNIIYPDSDGKYNINTLIDKEGIFYIIHPNENVLDRDMPNSLRFKETQKPYKNKVESIINYFKLLKILNAENIVTSHGKLIIACLELFMPEISSIEIILTILDLLSFNCNMKDNLNIFKNIIWYCIFSFTRVTIDIPYSKKVYSDFLGKGDMFPPNKLNLINLYDILNELEDDISNLDFIIKKEVNKIVKLLPKANSSAFRELLELYYSIKIKIEILEELSNPASTIIYNSKEKHNKNQRGKINRNCKILKNITMNSLPKFSERDISIIKTLNEYEQICFFICKNMKIKLLLKITGTPYYINYFNRKYKNLYHISYSPFNKNTIFTNVYNEYRNNIIFYLNSQDNNTISNIMWIPTKILYLLQKISKTEIERDNHIEITDLHDLYGKEECNNIFKKIDIINEYIMNK